MTQTQIRKARRLRAHRREFDAITSGTVYRVKVHHDGAAYITEGTPPGRYRRFTVVDVAASDPFEAIDRARNIV